MKVQIGTEYSAMEIAEYAVNRRYRLDMPISNLQLQKILYFLQVIYASKTDSCCSPTSSKHGPTARSSETSTLSSRTVAASR